MNRGPTSWADGGSTQQRTHHHGAGARGVRAEGWAERLQGEGSQRTWWWWGGQGGWKWGEEVSPRDQSEKLVNFCPVLLLHLKFSDPSPPHCRHLWTTSSPGLAAHVTATVLD